MKLGANADETDRLGAVADDLEIRGLIARLAHLADDGELHDYIELFTADAVWGGGGQPLREGREAILTGARERRDSGLAGPGAATRHVVTTTWIEITGDSATGRSVFHFYTGLDDQPSLAVLGVYRDEFRRTPEGWRLAARLLDGNADSQPPHDRSSAATPDR